MQFFTDMFCIFAAHTITLRVQRSFYFGRSNRNTCVSICPTLHLSCRRHFWSPNNKKTNDVLFCWRSYESVTVGQRIPELSEINRHSVDFVVLRQVKWLRRINYLIAEHGIVQRANGVINTDIRKLAFCCQVRDNAVWKCVVIKAAGCLN